MMDVDVLIRVDDPTVDGEELQQIVRVVAAELEEQGAIGALAGTEAEFEYEYEGVKFKFKGRNEQDREAAMQDFERFVATIAAAKRKD
ncbi:hypothetical protein [Alkalinema sp. FACHB-956]|uniref:hypothetical protein n=1 Tax=Alkalinema sp. FACHB-956 TaxID=2692768 RepID=UPI0016896923|nr:hypothetical protein [Alkalinema sp. FACHB-956]MBD2329156.1 hypothetical protein [Alkalinema sp. FACHB-956]